METAYAKIKGGIVISVEVVSDEFVKNNSSRYKNHIKISGVCGKGYSYLDKKFTPPQPYISWKLDKNNVWQAPIKKPEGKFYWDEQKGKWITPEESI